MLTNTCIRAWGPNGVHWSPYSKKGLYLTPLPPKPNLTLSAYSSFSMSIYWIFPFERSSFVFYRRHIHRSVVFGRWITCECQIGCFEKSHWWWVTCCSRTGRAHLLLISRTPGVAGGAIGIVTLEGRCLSNHGIDLDFVCYMCYFSLDIVEVSFVVCHRQKQSTNQETSIGNHRRRNRRRNRCIWRQCQ